MDRQSLLVGFLIVTIIVLCLPFSTATFESQDGWQTSQIHTRGGSRKVTEAGTTTTHANQDAAQNAQEGNIHPERKSISNKYTDMLQHFFAYPDQSFPRNGNIENAINRDLEPDVDSTESTRRAQLSTGTSPTEAYLMTDKSAYYDGLKVIVTFEVHQTTSTEWPFLSWVALFPHDADDYTNLQTWAYTDTEYGNLTGNVEFTTSSLPALGKYKAIMAIADTDPLRVIGVSEAFGVWQTNADVKANKTQYYEGEWIDITYHTISRNADSQDAQEYIIAGIGLFPADTQDYSPPPAATQYFIYSISGSNETIQVSSRNLPALNTKYKAVMTIRDSDPVRIVGVSNAFDVLQNSANLTTDEKQYYEGELIDVTYTMNENADNMEWDFAWIAFFPEDAQDYSLPPAVTPFYISGTNETIQVSSRNLPALNTKYKAVMTIRGSDPVRIVGVSNAFDVLQNSANLTTDKTHYKEGESIDVTYTMSQDADNMEWDFAWVALFAHDVSDYSLPPAAPIQSVGGGHLDRYATISMSSKYLPMDSTYKAVMAIADSNPVRILGVSNTFDVVQNSANLTTDETLYYEGELINVTYTMSQEIDVDWDFVWVALFAHNVTDYTLPPAAKKSASAWFLSLYLDSNATISFSSKDLPLDATYKAAMAIGDVNVLRILGVSTSFQIKSGLRPTTSKPTTPSPTMQPTSMTPTLRPAVVCPIGTFTKDCLPVIAIDTIFPSGGLVTGGFVVRVNGFNFGNFSNATVMCQFGASIVSGMYKSDTEVVCVAPDVSELGVVAEESAAVVFNVSIGGLPSYNSVPFEYFELCRRDACVNGFCAVTGCICDSGFLGETCITAVIVPRVKAINPSTIQVRENEKLSYLATVEEGDLPMLWTITVDPPQDGVYINPSTGALEWKQVQVSATGKPYNVTVFAENSGGSDMVSFQLEVLSEFIIEEVQSTVKEVSSGPDVTLVPIEGYCLFRDNRSVVPFCDAEIVVTKDGFRRSISAVARQDGKIRVSFVPFDEEGGTFYLSGQPKGFQNDTMQDSFSRFGLAVLPRDSRIVALTLVQIEESLTVLSLSDKVALGDLSVVITSPIPPEIQNISIELNSKVLAPNSNINAIVKVVARLPGTFFIQYTISTNTTAFASGMLSMGFQAPNPVLVADPPSIGLQAARGARSMAQIILTNSGGAATGDLQAIMPANFRLLQLASHSVIPSILPGESAIILFSSLPNATEPFQWWTGALTIQSTTVSLRVDFRIEVVSDLVGNLVVVTEDEATFHKEGNPPLNTSSVAIKNAVTLETFRRSVDATGSAAFANVPRGVYEVEATAANCLSRPNLLHNWGFVWFAVLFR